MTSVTDILQHAWNRDAANLMPALDDVMTNKISAQIDSLRQDMSSTLLSPVTHEEEVDAPEQIEDSDQGTTENE
jgi:hypothetical protein